MKTTEEVLATLDEEIRTAIHKAIQILIDEWTPSEVDHQDTIDTACEAVVNHAVDFVTDTVF